MLKAVATMFNLTQARSRKEVVTFFLWF